jgi:hypothetical protein
MGFKPERPRSIPAPLLGVLYSAHGRSPRKNKLQFGNPRMKKIAPIPLKKLVPIPPLSVVRIARGDKRVPSWQSQVGRVFRVGYYGANDGLDCIWLVTDEGKYERTADHDFLYRYFDVIQFGQTKNWFGRRRPRIPPILLASRKGKRSK